MLSQNIPAIMQSGLHSDGFFVTYNNNTSVFVSGGICRDSNNIMDIIIGEPPAIGPVVSAPVLLDLTKNGPNGLDHGSLVASNIYDVYVIGDSTGYKPSATLACLDGNAPVMPAGYDSSRLQFYIITNSSVHISQFVQLGNNTEKSLWLTNPITVASGNVTTPTYASMAGYFPSNNDVSSPYSGSGVSADITINITPAVAGHLLNANNIYTVVGQVATVQNVDNISRIPIFYQGGLPVIQWFVTASGDSGTVILNTINFSI